MSSGERRATAVVLTPIGDPTPTRWPVLPQPSAAGRRKTGGTRELTEAEFEAEGLSLG